MNFIVRATDIRPVIVKARGIKEAYDIFAAAFFDKEEDPDFIATQVLSVEVMDYEILNGDTL